MFISSHNVQQYLTFYVLDSFIGSLPSGRKPDWLGCHTAGLGGQTKDRSLAQDRLKCFANWRDLDVLV